MKIGIIGSGNIGGNLGKHWAKAGHKVIFSSRHPEELKSLVETAGENAEALSVKDAFEVNADVYLLAVPFKALDNLSENYKGLYANKVIIDATNPYPERDGEIAQEVRDAGYNASEYTAKKFATANTVKAFNTIYADHLRDRAFRKEDKLTIPYAAQNKETKKVVKQLIEDIGFDSLYIGHLSDTKVMDPDEAVYGKSLPKDKLKRLVDEKKSIPNLNLKNHNFAKNEKDYIRIYEEKGYVSSFHLKEGKLLNNKTKIAYSPQDIYIVAENRYEGMSNPSDMSILYVIETNKDEKGTFLMGFGPTADLDTAEFFKNIPEENISDKENIYLKN